MRRRLEYPPRITFSRPGQGCDPPVHGRCSESARIVRPKAGSDETRGEAAPAVGHRRSALRVHPARCRGVGPRFEFKKHGQSGAELGAPLRRLAGVVDDLCIVRSVHTDQFNHAPAQLLFNTGFAQPGRPCLGSWVHYGLGAETEQLPAFVVMSTGSGLSAGAALWSSGFLPTHYTGTRFRNGRDPILNVTTPRGFGNDLQAETYGLIERLNRRRLEAVGDPEIATRIASFEMASRLQTSAPELMDLRRESRETLDLYGCDPAKPSFARACLLARRMVERGVRFINIYHEGWDAHSDVVGNVKKNCRATDQGCAALIADLKRRGMLDETLVVWAVSSGGRRWWRRTRRSAASSAGITIPRRSRCGWPEGASAAA